MGNLFIPTAFILLAAAATAQFTSSSVRIALAVSSPLIVCILVVLCSTFYKIDG